MVQPGDEIDFRVDRVGIDRGAEIVEVAARVGFDTATYFSHIFHREVGCSPRAFRAQIGT